MKLDKAGKTWAKTVAFAFWSIFLTLYGGLYSPWTPNSPITGRIWVLAIILMITIVFAALAFLTESKENP